MSSQPFFLILQQQTHLRQLKGAYHLNGCVSERLERLVCNVEKFSAQNKEVSSNTIQMLCKLVLCSAEIISVMRISDFNASPDKSLW